jgi:hypothetical protein
MACTKFWKNDENQRPVYKKTVFQNIEKSFSQKSV